MAMTPAEKMKAYRQRKKEAGFKQIQTWQKEGETLKTEKKAEEKAQWQKELEQEQLAAARKEGRRLARLKDTNRRDGYIDGICTAAAFFCNSKIDRADIAQTLLKHFMIDREKAESALQSDKRTKSTTLELLDKYGAWHQPPEYMR
jgi:cell division protein YceG involved in septum cleavage